MLTGGVQDRCAPGDPDSGVAALRGAGFTPTRAAQQAGYFLCRIDGKPATDPCQRASPADAYWSYWHARPGGSWSYAGTGPADHDPAPGSIEGWAFGDGKPPSVAPPSRAAATRTPDPSPRPTATATAQAPPPAPPRPAGSRAPTASSAPSVTGTTTGPATAPTSNAAPSAPTGAPPSTSPLGSPSSSPLAAPVTDAGPDGGVGLGPVLALLVVALLGGGAFVQSRRRS